MSTQELDKKVATIRKELEDALRLYPDRANPPPCFYLSGYPKLVEPRLPDYKYPYVLDTYAKEPSPADLKSPCFRKFSHMEVLGYTGPYGCRLIELDHREIPCKIRDWGPSEGSAKRAMYEFSLLDKSWGQYKQTDGVKEALRLTRQLNSHVDTRFLVPEFGFRSMIFIALNLDLKERAGVPFSADPTQTVYADYLDRGFTLAEEIMRSATNVPASAVQAPPCHYSLYSPVHHEYSAVCHYPLSMEILESRFILPLLENPYKAGASDPFPSVDLPGFGTSFEEYRRTQQYCWVAKLKLSNYSIHPYLVDYAFDTVRKWFVMSPDDSKVWDFFKYYFQNTPVLLPSGQLVRTKGGINPGLGYEAVIKCIISVFAGVYGMLNQGLNPEEIEGNIHYKDGKLVMSVPRYRSKTKFVQDIAGLGFRVLEFHEDDNLVFTNCTKNF